MSFSNPSPVSVGIIGCGNIFPAYVRGLRMFRILDLKACADLNPDSAKARAEEFGIESRTINGLLADPTIDLVVNLTVPQAHARVGMDILRAGKHVYSEKPLAIDLDEGAQLLDLARESGLRVGCAPDTFLGAGLQSCRKLIDDGWIGTPTSGTAFMLQAGPESWHPNPAFFYQKGAGPLMDMGPYYVTALVHLLGPVSSVTAVTSAPRRERLATCKEQFGTLLPVDVPTHYSGSLVFASGAVVSMTISFDVHSHRHSPIEIYGSGGSLAVPDPNTFGGPVSLRPAGCKEWGEIPLVHGYPENSRGIGVADMAHAIRSGRPHRCDGALAFHALEVMQAFEKSSNLGQRVEIARASAQPAAFPLGLLPGVLDD
jgi:predicted dehydrogenase